MPLNAQVHIWPKEIGIGVNERGNVEIVGMDREEGTVVKIEIASQQWQAFHSAAGRLSGVGIYKANRKIEVVDSIPEGDKNGSS